MVMGNLSWVSVSGESLGEGVGSSRCRGRSECSGGGCAVQVRAAREGCQQGQGEPR